VKELDFDELDRAVNSLMAGVPKQSVPLDQPAEKTVTIDSAASHETLPSRVTPTLIPPASRAPSPSSSNAPAARRSGRFMDVVHPSSDMNPKKSQTPLEAPVSRQGVAIEPASSTLKTEKSQFNPVAAAPLEVPSTPEALKPASTGATIHSDWPDPLEVAGFSASSEEESKSVSELESDTTTKPVEQLPDKTTPEPPLVSPFLADTKVDKRPLGANAASDAANAPDTKENASTTEENDDQLPATIEDTKPILPAELHNDLMTIESDTTEPLQSTEEAPVRPEPPAPPVTELKEARVEEEESHSNESPKTEASATIPTGPVSISQQYKEEPSSEEPKSGAIYDTDTYHQPLAHPAKQKSGWMWVIWIILILILGVGVGAALYLLKVV
jgi:hypothetical protein